LDLDGKSPTCYGLATGKHGEAAMDLAFAGW